MTIDKLGLSPKAIQLVTEKPHSWEYRLFGQVIIDEVENIQKLFQRGHKAQNTVAGKIVTFSNLMEWMGKKSNEIIDILNKLTALVNSNHDDAFGLPGEPGNVENIIKYSRSIVSFYYYAMAWLQAVHNTQVASSYEEIHQELDALSKGITTSIEKFGHELLRQIDQAINAPSSGKPRVVTLTLNVDISTDRLNAALERLTKKIEDSGLTPEKFDQFESDTKLNHVILKNIKYWDVENEKLQNANYLDLFGHCFEARIYTRREPIKSVLNSSTELKFTAKQVENSQEFTVILENDSEKIFVMSQQNLDLLKKHYEEVNRSTLELQENFRSKNISIISYLLKDGELVEMAKNFIEKSPISFYVDLDYLILIELLIETAYTSIGRLLLLYPKELREVFVQKNSEFIQNNDISDVEAYGDELALFTQILKEKHIKASEYTTYGFLYNVSIEYFAQKWEKQYHQYFTGISKLTLEEAIERYCSIETINHQDVIVAGNFVYYLIQQGKFGEDNRNYFNCIDEFTSKIKKVLDGKKYKDFVNKLKTTSNKKKYTIDDVDLMNGQEFEKFIAELFAKMGFETKVTKASGDQGIDVIAAKNGDTIGIQAKCYSNTVGNSAIQEVVAGKNYYRLDKAMVITNNFFSDSARQLATANSIVLWDRNILREKIEKIYNVA
jgi:hypothetical protein